jgi:hypothetical protein
MVKSNITYKLIIPCLVFASCFGEGGAAVSGRIRDEAGRPISGAHVYIATMPSNTLKSQSRIIADGTSRADGCFDLFGMHVAGRLSLRLYASKESYKPYHGDFRSGFYTNDIVLASHSSRDASRGRFVSHEFQQSGKSPCQE